MNLKIILLFLYFGLSLLKAAEVLFDGQDVRVEANYFGKHKNLWICFGEIRLSSQHQLREGSETHFYLGNRRWGQPYFNHQEIDTINIENYANHWYQTLEMNDVIRIITAFKKDKNYENIITYGLSMGGYGAVLFAKPLGATRILGLSPRFQFIDIDRAGHRKCREQLNLRPIFELPVDYEGEAYIFVGAENSRDSIIVNDPNGFSAIIRSPVKRHLFWLSSHEHNTASYLLKRGLLKTIVQLVDKGDLKELSKVIQPLLASRINPVQRLLFQFVGMMVRFDEVFE